MNFNGLVPTMHILPLTLKENLLGFKDEIRSSKLQNFNSFSCLIFLGELFAWVGDLYIIERIE